jgi:2-polyprenyl-6-methoxyphenol hydroxylase-like FAD-dependent oxidoreductase
MTQAIVIGGGLAGHATALALARAGISAAVYEAGDGPADQLGAWLTLASNGMDALAVLGVADAVAARGFTTPWMTLRNGSGRELARFPSAVDRPDGLQVQTIRRADLYRVLREECARQGVPIVHGRRLVDAATAVPGGGVRATFADGSEATGDLLIGADGLRSRTRTIIDPAAPDARYTGLLNVGGYARGLDLGQEPGVMDFCFGTRCFLGYVTSPDGDVWWFANPPMRSEPTREQVAAESAEAWRPRLRELFAGDALPVLSLLDASDALFAGWPTYDIPRVRTWHRDGMVLVGDAVHAASPASGQGASMAFEDAVTLAMCLRDRPTAEAFAAYEQRRRPRVEKVVARGKRTGDAKAPGPVGRWLRDHVAMPLFAAYLSRAGAQRDAWLTGHHLDWNSAVRT